MKDSTTTVTILLWISLVMCVIGTFVCASDNKWPEAAIGTGGAIVAAVLLFL